MPTFWLSKTIAEIKAITANNRTDYCRIFCIDWLDFAFYHPGYSIDSTGNMSFKYETGEDSFMFIPNDIIATPGVTGAWLRDTDNILIKTSTLEFAYKPPSFRPYKIGQNVTLGYMQEITKTSYYGTAYHLENPGITSWTAREIPVDDNYDSNNVWVFNNATSVGSEDNPREINAWGAGGVLWFDKSESKLYINEASPSDSEMSGHTKWNEITFGGASQY